jgi:hypothetical protein
LFFRSARHIVITIYTVGHPRGFSFAHPTPGGGRFAPSLYALRISLYFFLKKGRQIATDDIRRRTN